jgi:geranylgeranylglycerol-phosphate geranylgeranyltransferase
MSSPRPFPVASRGFWLCYWITCRPYLFFVSAASGLVGLALCEGLGRRELSAAFLAFFLSYGLGQSLTDVFQTDTDAISSPYRPLTRGLITPRQVLCVSLVGLALCAFTFHRLDPATLALSALAVLGLLTYTPCKRVFWAGPLWNSWIVALLPAIGLLCGASRPADLPGSRPLALATASVFFSYAVFVLLGYFKDISADRATGYHTLPVRYGWTASLLVSAGFALAALCCSARLLGLSPLWRSPIGGRESVTLLLWLGSALALVAGHALMLGHREESRAHRAIACAVRGFVLLHLGEATAFRPDLALPVLGFYALFELALELRPERSQI